MAFTLANFAEISSSMNQGVITAAVATPSSDTPTLLGAQNVFSYLSPGDTLATIMAANYFLPVVIDLLEFDIIFVTGTDFSAILQVATSVPPTDITTGSITTQNFLSSAPAFVASVTVTNAALLGMYATPILLVPAQGAGTLIRLGWYEIDYHFLTAATAAGGLITAQYGATDHAGGVICTNGIPAATLNGLTGNGQLADTSAPFGGLNTAVENTGIYLSNASGAFTTGAGTAVITVSYTVLTPS